MRAAVCHVSRRPPCVPRSTRRRLPAPRTRHWRSCRAPCSPRVQTTRAGTQRGRAGTRAGAERLAQPVLPHRCCPTIPAPRQGCTEPPAPRRRAPSRAAAPTAYRAVLRRPVCVRKPAGEVCPDTAHGMRQLGACCRTPSPLQGTSMGRPRRVVQTPTGALPFATVRLPHAAIGSHL